MKTIIFLFLGLLCACANQQTAKQPTAPATQIAKSEKPSLKSFSCTAGEFVHSYVNAENNQLHIVLAPPEVTTEPLKIVNTSLEGNSPVIKISSKSGPITISFKKESCDKLETDEPLPYSCTVTATKKKFSGCGTLGL